MRTNKLKWLSLIGILGILGTPFGVGTGAFAGFLGFAQYAKVDERDQSNVGKAAWLTHIVSTFGYCILIVTIGISAKFLKGRPDASGTVLVVATIGIVALYMMHIFTFMVAYSLYDRRG